MLLKDIVNASLQEHQFASKVAAYEATAPVDDFDALIADQLGQYEVKPAVEMPKVAEAKTASALDTAAHGVKLAAALRASATTLIKLAAIGTIATNNGGGHESEHGKQPVPQGGVVAHTNTTASPDATGQLPNDHDKKAPEGAAMNHPAKTAERVAYERKVAESLMLHGLGRIEEAKVAAAEAKVLETKVAEMAAGFPANDGGGGSGGAHHIGSNEELTRMTKGQARDSNTRQASAYLKEPLKKDNAVQENIGRSDGQKVSAWSGALFGPVGAAIHDKEHRGSSFGRTMGGAVAGQLAGAVPGAIAHAASKTPKGRAASLLAANLGSIAGGVYGGHKGQESARKAHAEKNKDKKED